MGRQLIEGVPYHIDNYAAYIGHPIGYTEWVEMDQPRVNQFGEATDDMNPLHVDPAWAVANGPFGGPIAHGFLTLSMLSHLAWKSDLQPDGVDYGINLGFERVRFLAPVKVGDSIRMRASLVDCKPRGEGRWWFKTRVTIETEKTDKAALSAVWLILFVNEELAGDITKTPAAVETTG